MGIEGPASSREDILTFVDLTYDVWGRILQVIDELSKQESPRIIGYLLDQPVICLIDSGSGTTCISTDLFNLIRNERGCKSLPVTNVKIAGPFSKHTCKARCQARVPLKLGNMSYQTL